MANHRAHFLASLLLALAFFYAWGFGSIHLCVAASFAYSLYSFHRKQRRTAITLFAIALLALPFAALDLYWRYGDLKRANTPHKAFYSVKDFPHADVPRVKLMQPHSKMRRFGAPSLQDEYGRRKVPWRSADVKSTVLLLGCSFTYGTGVRDHETFASTMQKVLGKNTAVINAGIPGTGPTTAYTLLRFSEKLLPGVPHKIDAAVYTMLPDHVYRASGTGPWKWMDWKRESPKYKLKDGKLVFVGYHGDHILVRFLLRKLSLASYLRVVEKMKPYEVTEMNRVFSPKDLENAATLINELAALFKEKSGGRFIVNYWPHDPFLDRALQEVRFFERLKGVEVVVSPDLTRMEYLPDGHAAPQAHDLMGKWLALKLR